MKNIPRDHSHRWSKSAKWQAAQQRHIESGLEKVREVLSRQSCPITSFGVADESGLPTGACARLLNIGVRRGLFVIADPIDVKNEHGNLVHYKTYSLRKN